MRHDDIRELLGAFLDGELRDGERRRVEAHLRDCAPCRDDLDALRKLASIARDFERPPASLPNPDWDSFSGRVTTGIRPGGISSMTE